MTTSWPAYDGSDRTSWYPLMHVLKTTSPPASVALPPRSPESMKPSSSTSSMRSGNCYLRAMHHFAPDDGHDDAAAHAPALQRCVVPAAIEGFGLDQPLLVGIDQDPLVEELLAEDAAGPGDACSVDDLPGQSQCQHRGQRRLETVQTVSRSFLVMLHRVLVGCVVGRNHIDDAVDERVAKGDRIRGGT